MSYSSDYYAERKKMRLCTRCGQPLPANERRLTCPACRKIITFQFKKKQRKLKALGICVKCGKRPVLPGKVICAECSQKSKAMYSKRKEQATKTKLCIICHKNPVADGKLRCETCLGMNREAVNRYQEKKQESAPRV